MLIYELIQEGVERQGTWQNSTEILIEGFIEKLKKMKEEVNMINKKRKDNVQTRIEEFQNRLILLHQLIEKAKKEKEKQSEIMETVTGTTLHE